MEAQTSTTRGVVLNVPFAEKEAAKKLGARWDPDLRKWFVPRGIDARKFERWLPKEPQKEAQ
jgi:exodeoxyribonuclease VII large subunit